MKMIKLSPTFYVVVDESEIRDVRPRRGKWHLEKGSIVNQFPDYLTDLSDCKLITHSTEPLEDVGLNTSMGNQLGFASIEPLSLLEVEELVNGYSVEKMASDLYKVSPQKQAHFIQGFKAHQELVKYKLFTVEDMRNLMHESIIFSENNRHLSLGKYALANKDWWDKKLQSLLPKNEWEVTFDENGKLRLL